LNPYSVTLIASATQRSLRYLLSLIKANLLVEEVFILDECKKSPGQREQDSGGVMALRLKEVCIKSGIKFSSHESDVNSPSLIFKLKKSVSNLTIYSGYGGQIIKQDVLDTGKRILHIHAGALPEYRGSTTIYYAILNKESCGATAIILDSDIDTGTIVGSKLFDPPKSGTDIDFKLDIDYRVSLLINVVLDYQENGDFKSKLIQPADKGKVYYIAHPVLRHVAMLRGGSADE